MADALFNVGNRLSAEDWLRLSSAIDGVRNERNSLLRGVGAIIPGVSISEIPDSGFSTNLRRYSTANDEEITAKIIYGMADGDYKTEKEYVREYKRRNYPPLFMEKALAEWRRTKGREESAATARYAADRATQADLMDPLNLESKKQTIAKEEQRIKDADVDEAMIAVVKRAAEDDIQAIRDGKKYHAVVRDRLTNKSAGWEKNHSDYYKSLMAMADQKPEATATTKAVYDTRTGQQRWMTEADIQALNKATPGTIVPTSEAPADEQQVTMGMLSAASQVLYDDAILTAANVTADEARAILQTWASDRSWLARFNEIPENLRLLHKEWYKAYEGVMDRWYNTSTTGTVIGG